jgi:hypothetical protein
LQVRRLSEVIVIASRWLLPLFLLALGAAPASGVPAPSAKPLVTQLPHRPPEDDPAVEETRRKFEHDQQKKANQERFQKVKDDTEKLVQLSNELKEYVGKANENTLSLDVIKKAEEIERLAKSVKDKMRAN